MDYDKLPCVSICMPTWNRNNFKPLILQNIMGINYPKDKLEFVIDDDGEDKFIKNNKEFDIIQSSQGEGCKMADFNEKNVGLLDIDKCMCCVVHTGNTICKEMFKKEDNVIETTIHPQIKWTLCGCLGIK
jgi:ferredoxin